MLNNIEIKGFKCISRQALDFYPLTIVTGPNSTGKSTLLQAILLSLNATSQKHNSYLQDVLKPYSIFEDVFNQHENAREIEITLRYNNDKILKYTQNSQETFLSPNNLFAQEITENLSYEENIFYLSANRTGPQETAELTWEMRIGQNGQYAIGLFEKTKDKPIAKELQTEKAFSKTLKAQLAWWLSMITGQECTVESEKVTSTLVKISYSIDKLTDISPLNVGAGNSYLFKILVMCLTSKPGDILLIENPEIHLHPGAQARLGKLLAFLAQRGIQLVIETHCEHLINKIKYEVYSKQLDADKVTIYYKSELLVPFEQIKITENGHFDRKNNSNTDFPSGFFDATLKDLLEIA
jgi:predicted ATPase